MVKIIHKNKSSKKNDDEDITYDRNASVFKIDSLGRFDFKYESLPNYSLEVLAHHIYRSPCELIAHVRRIYFCFYEDLNEQLYAALLDFIIALNGKGGEISWRLFNGSKKNLSEDRCAALNAYFSGSLKIENIPSNIYSVLGLGIEGYINIIKKEEDINIEVNRHDVLSIARDCIEYSQLDEAQEVLENGIIEEIAREELHIELLNLYKSLKNKARFNKMHVKLLEIGNPHDTLWCNLNKYFMEA